MSKELVKYHNDFNKIKIPSFTAQEQDILMSIISKIRDKPQGETLIFTAQELAKYGRANATLQSQTAVINSLKSKFFKADFTIIINDPEKKLFAEKTINLFKDLTIIYLDKEHLHLDKIELSVNELFSYLVDSLLCNFTSFELPEFLELKSKYSKTLYRLLKQYKNTGKCLIYKNDWQSFCDFMNIPKSYLQADIDKKVLQPAILELGGETNLFNTKEPIFENLSYKKIKDPKGRGRGGKVVGIEFYFTAQQEQKQAITTQQNTTQSNENKVNNTINDLANKVKDFNRPAQQKEPQILEKRVNAFGQVVSDLDTYLDRHFISHNKLLNVNDTCKIKDIKQNPNGSITTRNLNQEDNTIFIMDFESFQHFKNWFNINKF